MTVPSRHTYQTLRASWPFPFPLLCDPFPSLHEKEKQWGRGSDIVPIVGTNCHTLSGTHCVSCISVRDIALSAAPIVQSSARQKNNRAVCLEAVLVVASLMAGTMSEGKMLPVEVSEGHLFPYYHMDKTLEVSSFYSGVCPLPIQGSSLWPVFYSLESLPRLW